MLGWCIHCARGVVSPTPERAWKLRLALLEICRRGRASGRDIEALSVFTSVYTFSRRHYNKAARIWPSIARELMLFADLLPLVLWDLKSP